MIKVISEHTIDASLLDGNIVIDAGCIGFEFSKAMFDFGENVYAFDIQDLDTPKGVNFIKAAISEKTSILNYIKLNDKQAYYIDDSGDNKVDGIRLNLLYDILGSEIDCLKLDIEGSEYKILADINFRPVPKQISVEMHYHCHRNLHLEYYKKCMINLLKYYKPIKHDWYEAHGIGYNYWDSLFIRKDLIK